MSVKYSVWRYAATVAAVMLSVLFSPSSASADAAVSYPLSPQIGNRDNYVSDENHLIPPAQLADINSSLKKLEETSTCEGAVCVVKTTGDLSIEDYTYNLFRRWGVGKKDKNNGFLIVIAMDDRKVRIEVGSGAEGVLTDIACANIIRTDIIPALKYGNIGVAIYSAVKTIYSMLTNPEVAREVQSAQGESAMGNVVNIDKDVLWRFLGLMALCVFCAVLMMLLIDVRASHGRDNYRRAMIWRSHFAIYWWSVLLSLGCTLPLAFIAYLLYRHARNVTEICPTCNGKMKKMNEEDDNNYLSSSQDFEERLGTVDYDVWVCPDCGTVERFPYREKQLKYKECPACGTVAMNLVCNKVLDPATTGKEGHGERVYQCQYCRNIHREPYMIPRKSNDGAALAAGVVLGSMLGGRGRGGGGGGGFSGGSFGGGGSSGGGASGGW